MRLFALFIGSMFFSFIGASHALAAPANRPNVLFIFVDDSGWGDFSCYGNTNKTATGGPITPNIDRLAAEGIRFTQGYVASPICSPSRTAVLTGMEPARYAIYSFLNSKSENARRNMADWVQSDTVSGPRLFKQAGYTTGQFGKWHMGNGRDVNDAPPPSMYGFDQSLVAFEGNGDRLLYWWNDGSKYSLSQANEDATVGTYEYCYWHEAAGKHTEKALKFMTNAVNIGKPFYMHVPFNDTHDPYVVPPGQENDFAHATPDSESRLFLGELHNLDKQIGRLMSGVDGLGVGENTIIVLAGDNGAPTNQTPARLLGRNGGLSGSKGNLYEGGIRVAFIARCPGIIPAGRTNTTTVVSTLDLLPTWCSLAGIPLPNAPFGGEDMSDVFRGSTRPRSRPVFWEYGTVSALSPVSPKLAIRQGDFKYMCNPTGTRDELYHIPNDPSESADLSVNASYAALVSDMRTQLLDWYQEAVLGNVGPTSSCPANGFTGPVISDTYDVPGNDSWTSGFGENSGVNQDIADRMGGAAAASIWGYRIGTGTRPASDFSIKGNRLAAEPRNANARFEFSPDGTVPFDFGEYLAGKQYDLSVQMDISVVGVNYAQRMSLSLSDTSDAAVQGVDFGIQIGKDTATTLGVFKRLSAGSVNTKILGGLPIGVPVNIVLRISDFNGNTSDPLSTYQVFVNGSSVNSGTFGFDASTSARYLIFDVAAHEGYVYYDNMALNVTGSTATNTICHKPILAISELTEPGAGELNARLYWTVQPGVTVQPQFSADLLSWLPLTNSAGAPLSITTPHGSFQWLNVPVPASALQKSFFRLSRQ